MSSDHTHFQPPGPARQVTLLVATRKGAWFYHGDPERGSWRTDGPHFLGHVISHVVLDPRDGRTLLAAAKTGHLGPTIFRSTDFGASWTEAARPPAFARAEDGAGRSVDHTFWLAPGPAIEPGVWYAGTSPQGLFRSDDGGISWAPFSCINDHPDYLRWMGTVQDGTPDGPKLHSIIVDPRDPAHLYFAMSGGGVHESLDGGRSFAPLIDGLAVVEGFDASQPSFHDPHCVRLCPTNPDRLYQQNHCGIYRLDRPATRWRKIGDTMPPEVGEIGFPMVVHPRDADTAWVFPMDGTSVWPRTSPDGRPAVYVTRDAGASWRRLDAGLPPAQAWWTVKRQAMTADSQDGVGLYFGTTSGELWASSDEGAHWRCIAQHLPDIYAVEVAERPLP
ncbi:glycosyl hydrolase [Methyloversatilis sp.]|uniref:WD40/YVTN/BNR-like repeat-containing protein n=1 Tax=Methyloversatilis sp. TaxID=2569862 RepID=UPI002734EECE|nr:glycosyl hydrolase [Methyloversatilis sp.]MDP2868410.1 glycosyl hydrolase [Methyloversatilis sp.]MDP3457329.1 glycosyl hydrolase [Methyloversatilis sp.]MDP3578722.1 glycosyl hydrolase [Methyloversatilis sp.]